MAALVGSKLAFLSELPHFQTGEKVRFLGCVNRYDVRSGNLILFHDYPSSHPRILVQADVSPVLETASNSDLEIGAWVNIIGYVTDSAQASRSHQDNPGGDNIVNVQAVMLWSAEPLKLDQYEKALELRRQP